MLITGIGDPESFGIGFIVTRLMGVSTIRTHLFMYHVLCIKEKRLKEEWVLGSFVYAPRSGSLYLIMQFCPFIKN